jgi:predicted RNA polymerase sigma factor
MGVDKFGIDRAIALANSSAVAAHIRMQLDRLKRDNVRRVPCK